MTATATAMNSAGSAAAENDRYMESINAHVQNLKATFQDFARNVFNEDFVKRILDTANAFLEFVNTPFGQAATRITLLSSALFGLGGILKGYWKYFVQGTAIAKFIRSLLDVSSLSGAGITGMEKFGAGLAKVGVGLKAIGPYVAIFAALAVAIKLGNKNLDEYNTTIEKTAKIQEEISGTQSEYDELIKKTGELTDEEKKRLEVLKELREEQERELDAAKQAQWAAWNKIHGTGAKTVVGGADGVGGGLGVGAVKTERADVVALKNYNAELAKIQEQYQSGSISAGAYYSALEKLNGAREESVEVIREAINAGYDVSDQQRQLVDAYDRVQGILGVTSSKTKAYVSGLISEAQQAGNTGKALYDLVAAQIRVSNTGMDLSQQITALKQLGYQAGLTAQQVNAALGMLGNYQDQRNIENTIKGYMYQGMTRAEAEAKVYGQMQSGLWTGISNVNASAFTPASYPTEDADDARQPQIKALQKEKDAVQDAIDAINDKYDDEVKVIEKEKDAIQDTIDEIKEAYNDQIDALEQEQDAVQETIDAINAKYDAQLDALDKYNDELEDEIELQQILEDMAKAKSTKKMVYKDGRFQYVEDLDAVAAAQTRLDEYNRKQALKKQKADIEEQRQLELKAYEDKKALLEQEQAIIEKRYELEIKSYESNKKLLEKEKENIETRRENELASYNERKNLLEQQIKALQDYGDTYVDTVNSIGNNINDAVQKQNEQLKKKLEESQSLLDDYNNTNKSKTPLTDKAKEEASTLTPEQRAVYDQWKSRGVGHEVAMKEAKKGSSSKPPLTKPSSAKSPQQRLAGGTMSAHGGLTLVGENGPELRVLNQGDGILPSNITRNLWTMATNPVLRLGHSVNTKNTAISVANITLPNVRNAEEFVSGLKNMAYQRAYARA